MYCITMKMQIPTVKPKKYLEWKGKAWPNVGTKGNPASRCLGICWLLDAALAKWYPIWFANTWMKLTNCGHVAVSKQSSHPSTPHHQKQPEQRVKVMLRHPPQQPSPPFQSLQPEASPPRSGHLDLALEGLGQGRQYHQEEGQGSHHHWAPSMLRRFHHRKTHLGWKGMRRWNPGTNNRAPHEQIGKWTQETLWVVPKAIEGFIMLDKLQSSEGKDSKGTTGCKVLLIPLFKTLRIPMFDEHPSNRTPSCILMIGKCMFGSKTTEHGKLLKGLGSATK